MTKALYRPFPEGVEIPQNCQTCSVESISSEDAKYHWLWEKDSRYRHGGKLRCRARKKKDQKLYKERLKEDYARLRLAEVKSKARYEKDAFYYRWKGYRYFDRKFGNGEASLEWLEAHELMLKPCSYCGLGESGGLDRRDNGRPHAIDNVVPCCVQCNLILTDMLPELKDVMASSLQEAREKGLLDQWLHPRLRHLK